MLRRLASQPRTLNLRLRYNITPITCFKIEQKTNPEISILFGNEEGSTCELHVRLFENVVPKTTENYRRLLLGIGKYQDRPLSLINNYFYRYIARGFLELGHLDGGSCSIYGQYFRDQSFELLHDRPGLLTSMTQENTHNSRFAITVAPCPFLDYRNTVFGEVTAETFDVLRSLERIGPKLLDYKIIETKELVQGSPSYKISHKYKTKVKLRTIS